MNATTTEAAAARPSMRDTTKILSDCRDLAVTRLATAFAQMLDRVGEILMERAALTDIREEQTLYLDTRNTLLAERRTLLSEFERQLHKHINDRIARKDEAKQDYSQVDASKLTLVDTTMMDESVVTGNIKRVVENLCHDELATFNRGIGFLLDRPDLETGANPLAPATIVDAFADALKTLKSDPRVKFQILKDLNQASLADIATIYADLNTHLQTLKVVPNARPVIINRGGPADRQGARGDPNKPGGPGAPPGPPPEIDVMAMFRRMYGGAMPGPPPGFSAGAGGAMQSLDDDGFPQIHAPGFAGHGMRVFAPMPATASGYIPGAPIISTADLHEGLTRLQAGQTGFDVGGAAVSFSGIPEGLHNVLRDLKDSPLGARANQLESMTIEMVAMLFDFIFDTKDLPDGIKALLARLQIPVLKAAMLDGAFFAKKSHPARLLVNELAQAGLGWAPAMGPDDPLYKQLEANVHAILDGFSDNLTIFDDQRVLLKEFLAEEEKHAEANILTTAAEIDQTDRQKIAGVVAKTEIERRIEMYPVPNFLASFLRQHWDGTLNYVYLHDGEESEGWNSALATLEELVWSVQPKKTTEDRKHLVAVLPSLLKRLSGGMHNQTWQPEDRDRFMANLVEAHAAAVKPSLGMVPSPAAAVAEAAKAQAVLAKAAGDTALAAKAEALAEAMTQAVPEPVEPEPEIVDDDYLEIARSLDRGMWIEFEADDGQLAFAKLAWVSPLRGTYLFTNRQGQKALSMSAEELAQRFRADRARLVEAEPLIDRAFSSMMTQMEGRVPETAVH